MVTIAHKVVVVKESIDGHDYRTLFQNLPHYSFLNRFTALYPPAGKSKIHPAVVRTSHKQDGLLVENDSNGAGAIRLI
ncbi:MAG: hypothetical protein AMXMBFR82_06900 [Candidatus Hydrogenedentota bacterium]